MSAPGHMSIPRRVAEAQNRTHGGEDDTRGERRSVLPERLQGAGHGVIQFEPHAS
jgi:hypothetical protein